MLRAASFVASVTSIVFVAGLSSSPLSAAELTEVWKATGFDLPESVSYDQKTNAYYVSNIGTDPAAKDGNGFISKVGADGKVEALKWVTGLNAPKSGEIVGDKLYVTDIDELVEIDIPGAKVSNRYPAPGAKFLNDLAVAVDGRIFIADTANNSIYLFKDGKIDEWVKDAKLEGPNGLVLNDTYLVVSSLGDISKGFQNIKPSNVKKIDLMSKEISDFGSADPIGNLDGIEKDGHGGVIVTANPQGMVYDVDPGEKATEIGKVEPGAADLEYRPSLNLLIIPQMKDSTLVAYRMG
jgi:hypothetical protein